MKKGLAVLLILMLLFSFAGCQSGGSGQEKEERSTEAQAAQNDAADGETRYGTTELMAGMIQEQTGGDLHSIHSGALPGRL